MSRRAARPVTEAVIEHRTPPSDPEKALMWEHMRVLEYDNLRLRQEATERYIAQCLTCTNLRDENLELLGENKSLKDLIAKLQVEIVGLKERVNQNSSNSSKPPSTDPPDAKRYPKQRKKSGRKQGGQPGHPGHQRALYPEDQVQERIDHIPADCLWCGGDLSGGQDDGKPLPHQVVYLPEVRVKVVEHRLHSVSCPRCRKWTSADIPDGVPVGNFAPQVEATVALLTGCYPLSRRNAVALMRDLYGLNMSLGVVPAIEKRVTRALETPVGDAKASVKVAPTVSTDATGWRQNGRRQHMFISVTPKVVTFDITPKHNADVVTQLLGAGFKGFLNSDRHSIYMGMPTEQRQVCLGHEDRQFAKMLAREGESKPIGEQGMALLARAFHEWHRFKSDELDRQQLQGQFKSIEKDMEDLVTAGASCCQHKKGEPCIHRKTQRTCRNMLKVLPAFWTFVHHEGVEPTNNASEQGLRRAVLKRKLSFGSKSEAGNRYVESMMTVAATCAKQGRHVLTFLVAALTAVLTGGKAPTLLPIDQTVAGPQPTSRDLNSVRHTRSESPRPPPPARTQRHDPVRKAA